jgi:hypothetical protein
MAPCKSLCTQSAWPGQTPGMKNIFVRSYHNVKQGNEISTSNAQRLRVRGEWDFERFRFINQSEQSI